jgi:hypothetical protein
MLAEVSNIVGVLNNQSKVPLFLKIGKISINIVPQITE